MKNLLLILVVFVIPTILRAQGTAGSADVIPPMPAGPPVLLRAPDPSQWIITITNSSPQTASPGAQTPPPARIIMTKVGHIMSRQTVSSDTLTAWCIGDLQITVYPSGRTLTQPRPANLSYRNPFYVDYSRTDFPDLFWVSPAYFAGIQSQDGKPCLYFKGSVKLYSAQAQADDLEAYVDLKTRLPVLFKLGQESYTYNFSPNPPSELELPAVIKSVLDDRAKATQVATRKIPVL